MGHGIPRALRTLVTLLPYRDAAAFDLIRAQRDELALVLVEGVQSSNPQPGAGEFLRELAAVCRDAGVLFGIDEVITGFRLAYGGAQERFGVTPDLAAYGKVLGGGLPVGAVTGRADLREVFTGLGAQRGIFSGGTFSGNPLTMEAGTAAVSHLQRYPRIYAELDAAGDRLAAAVNGYCEAHRIPAQMKQVGSMFHMFFQRQAIDSMRDVRPGNQAAEKGFYLHALNRGVLVPGTQRAFLSAAHGPQEIDRLIDVFQASLADVQAEGLFA
jgi:glutamate-1-semialdehyde 2,1-aminomutase